MKRFFLFTIMVVFLSFSSFGQRIGFSVESRASLPDPFSGKESGLDTIVPGNWDSATGVAVYSWEENMGYVFGTNLYKDKAYAQRFVVDKPYEILKAIFWIGEKFGDTGEVVFSIWDFNDHYPGELFASVSVAMENIEASDELEGAVVVEFEQPVFVTKDYLLGVDISGLDDFDPGVYGLANYSSTDENGTGLRFAYILEQSMWIPALNFDLDVDLAIFPIVNHVETYSVTLNVDLSSFDDFDPDSNKVYVSGDFNQWIEPGSEGSVRMILQPREDEEDPLIYTYTLPYIREGEMQYKYFSDAVGEGWEGGEWEGTPNRYFFVQENLVINDVWAEPSVGINEGASAPVLTIFPNPARDFLYVNGAIPIEQLRLFDLSGRLIFEIKAANIQTGIGVSHLHNGLYILQLISGQQIFNHKIQILR